MEGSGDLATHCEELLAINRALFDGNHPEAAFHALEAALHCAADDYNAPALRRIEAIAAEQHRQIRQRQIGLPMSNELPDEDTTKQWGSMERLYSTAERQASAKAWTIELRG